MKLIHLIRWAKPSNKLMTALINTKNYTKHQKLFYVLMSKNRFKKIHKSQKKIKI